MSAFIVVAVFVMASCACSFLLGVRFVTYAITLYARDGAPITIRGSKYKIEKEAD